MVDIRQTQQYANYLSKIDWVVERINKINYFIKKFPLIGSVIKIQRPEKISYRVIELLSKKYKAFQIILEPKDMVKGRWLMANGFKLSNSPYLPTKTLQLDLTKSKNELFNGIKKDARSAIRKKSDLRFMIYDLKDLEEFRNSWKKAIGWRRYVPPLSHLVALKKSFKTKAVFFMIQRYISLYRKKETIAGGIFLTGGRIGYYWQAFTSSEGRKALAQYKIVWEGIRWAKKMGAKVFDFEGIHDERFPNKSWLGFTHFKKSFGGYEISYPGTFVKNLLPFGL